MKLIKWEVKLVNFNKFLMIINCVQKSVFLMFLWYQLWRESWNHAFLFVNQILFTAYSSDRENTKKARCGTSFHRLRRKTFVWKERHAYKRLIPHFFIQMLVPMASIKEIWVIKKWLHSAYTISVFFVLCLCPQILRHNGSYFWSKGVGISINIAKWFIFDWSILFVRQNPCSINMYF